MSYYNTQRSPAIQCLLLHHKASCYSSIPLQFDDELRNPLLKILFNLLLNIYASDEKRKLRNDFFLSTIENNTRKTVEGVVINSNKELNDGLLKVTHTIPGYYY